MEKPSNDNEQFGESTSCGTSKKNRKRKRKEDHSTPIDNDYDDDNDDDDNGEGGSTGSSFPGLFRALACIFRQRGELWMNQANMINYMAADHGPPPKVGVASASVTTTTTTSNATSTGASHLSYKGNYLQPSTTTDTTTTTSRLAPKGIIILRPTNIPRHSSHMKIIPTGTFATTNNAIERPIHRTSTTIDTSRSRIKQQQEQQPQQQNQPQQPNDEKLIQSINDIFATVVDTSQITLKEFRILVEESLLVTLDKKRRKLLKEHVIDLIKKRSA